MAPPDPKSVLQRYLDSARGALLFKLDGLSEYDIRRPLTPTGTNLLGIVKHAASVELGHLGECMGRATGIELPWFDEGAEPNADLWATPDESRDDIVALAAGARAHTAATIRELEVDAPGSVPWWGDDSDVTLRRRGGRRTGTASKPQRFRLPERGLSTVRGDAFPQGLLQAAGGRRPGAAA